MVEGSVWGGATETVLACDLVVAAEGAAFAVTPARLGVPYNVGGMLTFLNAAPLRLVKEMVFTAEPMDAAWAERRGMVNHVVPAAELEGFTRRLARAIAGNAPLSVAVMKEQLRILAGAHPMSPQGFERVAGAAAGGVRQRGLPGGHPGLQGEAPARVQGRVSGLPGGATVPAAPTVHEGRGERRLLLYAGRQH